MSGEYGLAMYSSSELENALKPKSLIPYFVTMALAIFETFCKSSEAPLVI